MVRTVFLVLTLLLLLPLPGHTEDVEEGGILQPMQFRVRDRNAARLAVRDVERYLEDGRLGRAFDRAQEVLDDLPDDLVLVESTPASTRWRLATEEVRDVLSNLPPARREIYDRRTQGSANEEISRALASRDERRLEDIVTRYGASRAGVEAARLLSASKLEAGRVHDAAWWAREGLRYAPSDPALLTRLIDAWGLAGAREDLLRLAEATEPALSAPLRTRVDAWRQRLGPTTVDPDQGWPLWGGEASRGRAAPTQGPALGTPRWESPVLFPFRSLDRDVRRGWMQEEDRLSFWAWWDAFRPLHPAVGGDTLYVSGGRALHAVDIYSGRRLWSLDDQSAPALGLIPPAAMGLGRTSFERAFAPVLWKDLVIATVEVQRPYEEEHVRYVEISTYLPHRIIVAVDRKTGALKWSMGERGADRLLLHDWSIVSPCVVSDGLVVAVAARYTGTQFEVGLLGLDAASGRVRWHRSLGVGQQELNLFGYPVKELSAAAPAIRDGVAYATSGLGFIAAVSIRTGRPLWVASYQIQPIWPEQRWWRAPLRFPSVAPSPVIATPDLVLDAPTDGRHLSAYNAKDGRLRWRVPYPPLHLRGATTQFIGVAHDGHREVALLASDALRAYALDSGKLVWMGDFKTQAGRPNVPVGRGIVAGDAVLVPTTLGLARFKLSKEGSFDGMTPWPDDTEGGNILPLEHVLLLAERDRVVGFYSWDRIEQDVARRQREHPGDPEVLLEAGDVYAMGGAFDRAIEAFEGARKLAGDQGDKEARDRAEAGLFRTWMRLGEQRGEEAPEAARAAFVHALEWARHARERVAARVHLDELLREDLDARAENLERIVEDAAGILAHFAGHEGPVPARALALLLLAETDLSRGKPEPAVAALQRLLAEEGDRKIEGLSARHRARTLIDSIRDEWGDDAYAPYEREAEHLLQRVRTGHDDDLLAEILLRFPNARVIPEALYRLAETRLGQERPGEAARALQDLLRENPGSPWAAPAAAGLAAAYEALGQRGVARFAWTWLGENHAGREVKVGEVTATGARWAAKEAARLLPPAPSSPRPMPSFPLHEVHVEPSGADSWGAQVSVESPPGRRSPLALYRDGERMVAINLPQARVAFETEMGHPRRAAWGPGTLVIALRSLLVGLDETHGDTRWEAPIQGSTTELITAHGLVFALIQDNTGGSRGRRTLKAFDLDTGTELWRRELDRMEYRDLQVVGTDLLIRETRYEQTRVWPSMLLFDGLTGESKTVLHLPAGILQAGPIPVGRALVYVARDPAAGVRLTGVDLDGQTPTWHRTLLGREGASALLALDGEENVLVLQRDGFLATCRASDGSPLEATRILVSGGLDARPHPMTEALVVGDNLLLMPYSRKSPSHVAAWNRHTGKLRWDRGWNQPDHASRAGLLVEKGGPVVAMAAWTRDRPEAEVRIRLLDVETGAILQEIHPQGLGAARGPLSIAAGWGTVVVFGNDAAIVYAATQEAR